MNKRDYPKLCPAAESLENATGEKSAQRIARERGYSIIKDTTSWREIHEELAEVGLRFEKKGSGALVWVGDVAVKASSVDRAFSMPKQVKLLGEFTEGDYPKDRPHLNPEPVTEAKTMFANEWHEYQQEQEAERKKLALILNRKKDALQCWEDERKARQHGTLRNLSHYGLSLMNLGRHFLKEQLRREKGKLLQTQKAIPKRNTNIYSFQHWFSQKTSRKSVLWRLRKKLPPNLQVEKFIFPKIPTSGLTTSCILRRLKKNSVKTLMVLGLTPKSPCGCV